MSALERGIPNSVRRDEKQSLIAKRLHPYGSHVGFDIPASFLELCTVGDTALRGRRINPGAFSSWQMALGDGKPPQVDRDGNPRSFGSVGEFFQYFRQVVPEKDVPYWKKVRAVRKEKF